MIKVVLLGAGNVSTHLFEAFQETKTASVIQVYNRSKKRLQGFNHLVDTTSSLNELKEADIYIIAVKDDSVEALSKKLTLLNKLVVHTSGSIAMEALNNNHRYGVFYPLQTFTKGKQVDFSSIPICLETNIQSDIEILEKLAQSISQAVYKIDSVQRKALHVAAVFVNNFVNHLYQKGHEICQEHQVPFEVLHPLLLETAKKVTSLTPKESQTGPAIRNDQAVINNHIESLATQQQKDIYTLLTKSIQETHGNKL